MWKMLIGILASLAFATGNALAEPIISYDFNDQSFGVLDHGTYWTIQPNGGTDNTPAARLEYSVSGTLEKYLTLNLSTYESNEFYVEFDAKIENTPSGGCKFVKFFGSTEASQNNMTFGLDNWSNVQREVAYYGDTLCTARWDGTVAGSCTPHYIVQSSAIDMRGGSWGHYKLLVKRASPGELNGEVKVWWNGTLKAHITQMDSNPSGSSTPYFERVEFGGYMHTTYDGNPWYLWIDNLIVSITDPSPPALPLSLGTQLLGQRGK